mmetsp:Transcript_25033/g.42633  ORF Transcript_25033/g.42633 Transcript_25033/m.42633 type:complete len:223 (+) Transcript_25033:171-839(+)
MIGGLAVGGIGIDSSSIVHNRIRVDGRSNGSTSIDFRHNGMCVPGCDHSIFDHSSIGECINLRTRTTHARKGVAGAADIVGMAGGVDIGAESFVGVIGASHVGHAGIVGDVSLLLDEFKDGGVVSSVARSCHCGSAIEDGLDRKVNVIAFGLAGNLDTVSETAQGTMSPTRSTVLRKMLIERMSQVGDSIDISPRKGVRQSLLLNVRVRKWLLVIVLDLMTW